MRQKTICISESNLLFIIGGQLFYQAPNNTPRHAMLIMKRVKELFRKDAEVDNEWWSLTLPIKEPNTNCAAIYLSEEENLNIEEVLSISEKIFKETDDDNNLYTYIDKLLKSIPEFRDLNLSQEEYENNISVDDPDRSKYSFHTRYDIINPDSWRGDFVDLDAFVQNVVHKLIKTINNDEDCFLCKKEHSDECLTCKSNPSLSFKYECIRQPKGEYTFSCKFDCLMNKCICCEECKEKETCKNVCDGKSCTCGNKVME